MQNNLKNDHLLPIYWHCFNLLPDFGPNKLFKLWQFFQSGKNAFDAQLPELLQAGLAQETAEKFLKLKPTLNLRAEWEKLQQENIWLLSRENQDFPKLLLEIACPPTLLYVRGEMQNPEELCIALVGTRKITNYGRMVAPQLAENLALNGCIVVSGMALGIDGVCHKSVTSLGKRTIAVLAGGLDEKTLYPQSHCLLAEEILQNHGALLSEYPPKTPALKHHFIARNRIISGLALGTVVIESDLKSGSLITAQYALEQNRAVYAVPGPIYSPQSQGTNNLIKMGAKIITSANDILEDLNLEKATGEQTTQDLFSASPAENQMLKILSKEPTHTDELIKLSGLSAADATSALTFLEMKGKIRNLGGQQYVLCR